MAAPRFILEDFWPSDLFLGGVPGAWYDPTDLSTMFQDSTGTTPVTAVEQPVGLIFDKSGNANHATQATAASRPTYRARYNLLTQSEDFSQAVWVKFGGGTGVAPVVTTNAAIAPDGTLTADSIAFNRGAGNLIADQSTMYQAPTVVGGSHTQTIWLKAATAGDVGKQLALRNVAGSSYGAVTLTADWVRYSRVETGSAANFEIACRGTITTGNTVTALVWGAQLLTAADVTATGNAYQRIAAATVYDTAPIFRPYLAFDGVDDSLATAAAVNLTSTRQASVFVGQTKLSDAAGGVILGHGVDFSTVGAFEYQSNTAVNATTAFRGRSTAGSAAQAGFTKDVTSPGTFVFTSLVDYTAAAGSEFAGRYNTVAQAQNIGVAEENTGTFGNNVLTIGARQGGASQRFNGRIYELIVRGAASSTTEIIDAELWVNARTGAY